VWGRVQVRLWAGCDDDDTAIAFELQAEGDYRPNVLVVPLSPCGFNKAQLVDLVNVCRSSLTEFFSEISQSSQIAVGKAFEALARIRETPPTAVPNHTVATHIADFVGINERPANISMVQMLDLSSMWGLSPLRQLSPNELDTLGGCSVAGILDMLKAHKIMGVLPKLQK